MRKLHFKSVIIGTMLAMYLPVMADDCVMHVRTVKGETLDVTVTERASAALYGNTQKYPESVFYTYTGQVTQDEDGRAIPLVEDGVTKGAILCEMPLINIAEITFTLSAGISNVHSDALGISISDGIMRISRVTEPVRVTIAAISGAVEYDSVIDSDSEIDLNRFGSGVHTIAAGDLSFKTLVK